SISFTALLALAACPLQVIVISDAKLFASFTNWVAGRACSPSRTLTAKVRSIIGFFSQIRSGRAERRARPFFLGQIPRASARWAPGGRPWEGGGASGAKRSASCTNWVAGRACSPSRTLTAEVRSIVGFFSQSRSGRSERRARPFFFVQIPRGSGGWPPEGAP